MLNSHTHHHNANKGVKSPCKNICTLDEKGKCIGCFRKLDEIANWSVYTDDEKRQVLKLLELRMQLPEYFD